MTCGIYMIKNKVNGKMYIGQSVNIEDRWRHHKNGLRGNYHDNEHLQKSWNKHKEDNFEFTVICECDESQLSTMEIDYIAKLKTYDSDFGYNKTYGGDSERPTEETKRKMCENHADFKGKNNPFYGKHPNEETRKKRSESLKGRTHSHETKQKISAARKGKYCGKNHPNYGKHHSEETRKKISKAKSKPIVQIDASTNKVVNVWGSSHEPKRIGGFHQGAINDCCKGKRKSHKGYRWMYLSEYMDKYNGIID